MQSNTNHATRIVDHQNSRNHDDYGSFSWAIYYFGATMLSTMILRTGIDLIEISRLALAVERHGDRFLQRVFTPTELQHCAMRMESLAARFAAKEATAKALGTGIWRSSIGWTDIEVGRNVETGEPLLQLHGAAQQQAKKLGLTTWSISITHGQSEAIALVVAVG